MIDRFFLIRELGIFQNAFGISPSMSKKNCNFYKDCVKYKSNTYAADR